jgi:hypothetical protein
VIKKLTGHQLRICHISSRSIRQSD